MISKVTLLLTIVGAVMAANFPRKVLDYYLNGSGYGYTITRYHNGTWFYRDYLSFAWDFDMNCAWSYVYNYETTQWVETSMCQGQVD
jgi:hypothetical protein